MREAEALAHRRNAAVAAHRTEALAVEQRVPKKYLNGRITGIVGTSTLARRGTLTIDFAHSRMVLGGATD